MGAPYASPMVKRTTLNLDLDLDLDLVAEARKALGTKGTTGTIHKALAEVVRRERLAALACWRFDHLEAGALEMLRRS